ncbi:hypothetical protein FNU76_09840 [Chitinimonas arctica]|uniref:Leucine-rich repeat domain-containing protein n=1 Tax=Chitinimonas arctica TaxID=2594795 RepID=A0A516SER9_9NEIS|nr:hypothetical protein [Chitinimonas arctica]QDQ26641.1 hypothetical protein FNU76_09840 [Chitinimonas arctica]
MLATPSAIGSTQHFSLAPDRVVFTAQQNRELEALRENQPLLRLDWSGQQVSDAQVVVLVQALRGHTRIAQLDLGNNLITLRGACALADFLQHGTELEELVLAGNQLKDAGIRIIAGALKDTKLDSLDLANNQIGDDGAQALADVLLPQATSMKTLVRLNLCNNRIGDPGAKALLKLLEQKSPLAGLSCLSLDHNPISEPVVRAFIAQIARNQAQLGLPTAQMPLRECDCILA